MKTTTKHFLLQLPLALLPLIYLAFIWASLNEQVPLHYNINNEPDRMGSKTELALVLLFMSGVSMGLSALLNNIHKIDPKHRYPENAALMQKIAWTLVVFLSVMGIFIVYQTLAFQNNEKLLFAGKGVLVLITLIFIVLGNFLNNVKPNYFVGFRTPWNLENEENWRKTHHLAAKLMFYGGLLQMLLVIALPEPFSFYAFLASIVPIVLIPFVYSFLLFKKEKK